MVRATILVPTFVNSRTPIAAKIEVLLISDSSSLHNAGKKLPREDKERLEQAKVELRKIFHKE
jgi:hypothetical protein